MDDDATPQKPDAPSGAPAWMATFADLATLLMCFFVLILSFSEMDLIKYKQIAGSMKEAFGVQRDLKTKQPPRGINVIAKEFSPGRPKPTPLNVVKQNTTDNLRQFLKLRAQQDQESKIDKAYRAKEHRKSDRQAAAQARADAGKIKQTLDKEIKAGLVEVGTEQQKVIIRIREKGTFASGSAELIESFVPVLGKMAAVLAGMPGRIIVAGHTDDRPIRTARFRSNWELSASRAVSVVHALLRQSELDTSRFEVTGFGDTRPLGTNDTAAGRANNRRVELMIVRGDDLSADDLAVETPPAAVVEEQDIERVIDGNSQVLNELIDGYANTDDGTTIQWLMEGLSFLLGGPEPAAQAEEGDPPPVEIEAVAR